MLIGIKQIQTENEHYTSFVEIDSQHLKFVAYSDDELKDKFYEGKEDIIGVSAVDGKLVFSDKVVKDTTVNYVPQTFEMSSNKKGLWYVFQRLLELTEGKLMAFVGKSVIQIHSIKISAVSCSVILNSEEFPEGSIIKIIPSNVTQATLTKCFKHLDFVKVIGRQVQITLSANCFSVRKLEQINRLFVKEADLACMVWRDYYGTFLTGYSSAMIAFVRNKSIEDRNQLLESVEFSLSGMPNNQLMLVGAEEFLKHEKIFKGHYKMENYKYQSMSNMVLQLSVLLGAVWE